MELALLFLSRPSQLHSNVFQKEEGLQCRDVQTDIKPASKWILKPQILSHSILQKERNKNTMVPALQKARHWSEVSGVALLGVRCANLTHLKKQPTLFSQMTPQREQTSEQTQLRPHWFPSGCWFCDKHSLCMSICISTNCSKSPECVQHMRLLMWPPKREPEAGPKVDF